MVHKIEDMIAVMQAAKEGKEIEWYDPFDRLWKETEPNWDWVHNDYRIKPKQEYIPYETAEEFMQDQQIHGVYFTDKSRSEYYLPSCVSSNKNNRGVSGEGYYLVFATLFRNYMWQDGSPCGKLKE